MNNLVQLKKTPPYATLSARAKDALFDAYVENACIRIEVVGEDGLYTVLHHFDGDGFEVRDPDGLTIVEGAPSWAQEVEAIVRV
jgi:hypothetical protein